MRSELARGLTQNIHATRCIAGVAEVHVHVASVHALALSVAWCQQRQLVQIRRQLASRDSLALVQVDSPFGLVCMLLDCEDDRALHKCRQRVDA